MSPTRQLQRDVLKIEIIMLRCYIRVIMMINMAMMMVVMFQSCVHFLLL